MSGKPVEVVLAAASAHCHVGICAAKKERIYRPLGVVATLPGLIFLNQVILNRQAAPDRGSAGVAVLDVDIAIGPV